MDSVREQVKNYRRWGMEGLKYRDAVRCFYAQQLLEAANVIETLLAELQSLNPEWREGF